MCFRTKASLLLLALFIGAGVFSMSVQPAQAASLAELQQIINDLKAQIIALQERLTAVQQGEEDPGEWCHTFNTNLRYKDTGAEVIALQTALKKQGFAEVDKDASGSFGGSTFSAVVYFQEKYANDILSYWGLTRGTGFLGKTTRDKLNQFYGCDTTPVPECVIGAEKKHTCPDGTQVPWCTCIDEASGIGTGLGWACIDSPENQCIFTMACQEKCQAKGYDKWICRKWAVVPDAEWGCKDNELNVGQTSDCYVPSGLVGVSKTCCCQKVAEEDCRDENYECTINDIPCCSGLKAVGLCFPEGEHCICATCGTICRPCGNGVCDANENKCNCPEDCGEAGENLPPVIDGLTAPTQLKVNEKGVWTIKARDPENGALSYSVNWGDEYGNIALPESAPSEIDTRSQTTTFTHSYSQVGIYTIDFTVTDDHRQTAKTSTTIKVVSETATTCTDSDGGINKYVKGITCRNLYTLDSSSSDPTTTSSASRFCRTDRCIPIPLPDESGTSMQGYLTGNLTEYYCKDGKIFSTTIYCESGCFDGACKTGSESTCIDSDGGKNYYKKGSVSKCYGGICIIPMQDFCIKFDMAPNSTYSGKALNEYYCDGNEIKSEKFECPNGCENGACTEECTTDEDCQAIGGCIQVVGGDQAKCDLTTNTCYCGGVCGDRYCDSVEKRDESCPEDCAAQIQ